MALILRAAFTPNCVWIPNGAKWRDSSGEHVDPTQAVLLMHDGGNNSGEVYTKSAWENDGPPSFQRHNGRFVFLDDEQFDSVEGEIELLPDLYVVKIDEREHWIDPVVLLCTTRLFGVYVFDRRHHIHICSVTPCHELHFLGSQWECRTDLTDEENEELWEKIQEGGGQTEHVSYWDKSDIDRFLKVVCKVGDLPPIGIENSGFRLDGITAVTAGDAVEEVREAYSIEEF